MGRGVREGAGARIISYGGTALDHSIRAAVNDVKTLEHALAAAEASYAAAVRAVESARNRFVPAIAEAKKKVDALAELKKKESPGQPKTIPGLTKGGVPRGLTLEEWHELRRQGKHLEYLEKLY